MLSSATPFRDSRQCWDTWCRSVTICGSWSRCNQTWWALCSEAAWTSGIGRKGRHSGVQAHLPECAALWQEVADLSGFVTLLLSGDPGTQLKKGISQDFADGIKNHQRHLGLSCALVHYLLHMHFLSLHSLLSLIHLSLMWTWIWTCVYSPPLRSPRIYLCAHTTASTALVIKPRTLHIVSKDSNNMLYPIPN